MKAIFFKTGETVDYTATSAVSAGDVIALGNNRFGIAIYDIPAGDSDALTIVGVFSIKKAARQFAAGAHLYWDAANQVVTDVAVENGYIGRAYAAAASGDENAYVHLNAANLADFTSGITPQSTVTVGATTAPTTSTITGNDYTGQAAIIKAAIEQNNTNNATLKTAISALVAKLVAAGILTE